MEWTEMSEVFGPGVRYRAHDGGSTVGYCQGITPVFPGYVNLVAEEFLWVAMVYKSPGARSQVCKTLDAAKAWVEMNV